MEQPKPLRQQTYKVITQEITQNFFNIGKESNLRNESNCDYFSTPSCRFVNKALLHRLVGLGCLLSSLLLAFSSLSDRIRCSSGVDVATIALPRFCPADFSDLGGA
jgi:hypothetical protein